VTAGPAMEQRLRRTMIDSRARYLPLMTGQADRLWFPSASRQAGLEEQDFENRMLTGYIKNWPE